MYLKFALPLNSSGDLIKFRNTHTASSTTFLHPRTSSTHPGYPLPVAIHRYSYNCQTIIPFHNNAGSYPVQVANGCFVGPLLYGSLYDSDMEYIIYRIYVSSYELFLRIRPALGERRNSPKVNKGMRG